MRRFDPSQLGLTLAVAIPSLVVATVVVWYLQDSLGVPNPSAVYLVAVVATAFVAGTTGAILATVGAALTYNFLFTEPRHTFTIDEPAVWLSVVLLLFVGIVVGQLAALQRSRAEVALAREHEARALFQVSRALATRTSTRAVLPTITTILLAETRMHRVWIALGSDDASERIAADSGDGKQPTTPGRVHVLRRMPGDEPARWMLVHQPTPHARLGVGLEACRVRMEAGGEPYGSVWGVREQRLGKPGPTETRLMAAAADQVGQALAQDRLADQARAAEIARHSDALKSALLQSVSHDLRTPLATIRAAAGTLRPGTALSVEDQQESAEAIDREVEYLDRLVTNLLDLSRIEAGALRVEKDVFELDDFVGRTLERLAPRFGDRPLEVDLGAYPVIADPTFLDQAVTNIVENVLKYTTPETAVRVSASVLDDGMVRLTVEDAGEGVPEESLPRLFEKFYRVPRQGRSSRPGTGIGLAVVRGLVEAMGGRVRARGSRLGGLAIDLDLPAARVPKEPAAGPGR